MYDYTLNATLHDHIFNNQCKFSFKTNFSLWEQFKAFIKLGDNMLKIIIL